MAMIGRITIFILCLGAGLAILRYTLQWVNTIGKNAWAEEHMGGGGTYTLWKLIAILLIIFGFMVMIGSVDLHPKGPEIGTESGNVPTQSE